MQLALSYLSYFSGRVLHFSPVLASDCDPPTSGILCLWDLKHMWPHLVFVSRQGLANICLGFPRPLILLNSVSHVAVITCMRHLAQPLFQFSYFFPSWNVPGNFFMPSTCMCVVTFSCPVSLLKSNFLKETYSFHSV
jgi:hypothetical protein